MPNAKTSTQPTANAPAAIKGIRWLAGTATYPLRKILTLIARQLPPMVDVRSAMVGIMFRMATVWSLISFVIPMIIEPGPAWVATVATLYPVPNASSPGTQSHMMPIAILSIRMGLASNVQEAFTWKTINALSPILRAGLSTPIMGNALPATLATASQITPVKSLRHQQTHTATVGTRMAPACNVLVASVDPPTGAALRTILCARIPTKPPGTASTAIAATH